MKKSMTICFLLLFLFTSGSVFSGNSFEFQNKLKFYKLTVGNGLANNNVAAILQDSTGFMWFGTTDGLCRYDGANFLTFRNEHLNSNSLGNNDIQCLYYDRQGRIWVGTDNGLDGFDPTTNTFLRYGERLSKHVSVINRIISITGDSHSNIYAATTPGNILKITSEDSIETFERDLIFSNQITSLAMENDSILWVGYNAAVQRINLNQMTSIHYRIPDFINQIHFDNHMNLWIASSSGVWFFEKGSDGPVKLSKRLFSDINITSIYQDRDDVLWIGTRNGGLNISKEPFKGIEDLRFHHYLPRDDMQSVSSRTALCIYEDRDNNMWIGTFSSGVNFVNPSGEKIVTLTQNPFDKNSLSHKRAWGLCEDHEGNLWIGADGGGLNKFDPIKDEYTSFIHEEGKNGLSDNSVLCLAEDSKHFIWIGTFLGGLNRLDPETGQFKIYKHDPGDDLSLARDDVRTIFEDSKKRLWIGLNGAVLSLYHPETETFEKIDSFTYSDVRAIVEDSSGGLWVATNGKGLIYYHHDQGIVKVHNTLTYPQMETDRFYDLLLIDNDIWLASRNRGLIHYNIETDQFNSFSEKDGLINNNTKSLIAESDHEIWISTSKGISLFDIAAKTFINYGPLDGIQAGEFNPGSALISKNGYMCFGGNEGVNIFDPGRLKYKDKKAHVVFTGFRVFDQPYHVDSPANDGTGAGDIILKYNQRVYSIDFVAISFPFSNQYKYTYILENYDRNWSKADAKTSVTYRNMPPGNYTFKVKALANNDLWQSRPIDLSIIVKPPFWKTAPAFILYTLFGGAIFLLIMYYYTKHVKLSSSLYFEKKLRNREHELNEERLQFFTNFSHELRTPLTLILAPLNDLIKKNMDESAAKKLTLIQRNAIQLSKLIDKLLEFRKAESGFSKLSIGRHNLVEVVAAHIENHVEYAHSKSIELYFHTSSDKMFVWMDIEKIRIVVNNLLSNAFKHTSRHGRITVSIVESDEQIEVSVQDSGAGIRKDALDTIFNWYYSINDKKNVKSTGLGLAVSKRYVEMHHGELKVESEYGKGARFYFNLFKNEDPAAIFIEKDIEWSTGVSVTDHAHIGQDWKEDLANDETVRLEKTHPKPNELLTLIIDDNHDVLEYLGESLKEEYKIIMADNGMKGIEMAFEYIPDLIVSDVMMPVKSGLDLCAELKNDFRTSHIPIILLTAKTARESVLQGLEKGADEYVSKPFDMDLLKTRMRNLIANRHRVKNYFSACTDYRGKNNKEEEFLNKLNAIILEKNLENDLSVNAIAQELGFSRPSLYRKLKAITDLSINEYINKVRIKRAEELISSGEMNISEAAFFMGFHDIKHFRAVFKKQTGKLPSEVKKQVS